MARTLVSDITDRESIDQIFLVTEKQLRSNRNGNLYLQMRLSDRTGAISAMMWNATERDDGLFQAGDYLNVKGTAQVYNGSMQLIVTHVGKADTHKIDDSEFFPLGQTDVDQLVGRLSDLLRGVRCGALRSLGECYLTDDEFMAKFTAAPAGIKNHHAYRGGLLEHVVSLMELTRLVAPHYEALDKDLLLYGAFLHDIGKIDELSYERALGYTDEGQLIGHIVMAVSMLDQKIRQAEELMGEEFPKESALRLKHMIVSHHGRYEFGSPKLPMTIEAVVLSHLDDMDAKIHSFSQLIREDPSTDANWTSYQPNLERKIYKGDVSGRLPPDAQI